MEYVMSCRARRESSVAEDVRIVGSRKEDVKRWRFDRRRWSSLELRRWEAGKRGDGVRIKTGTDEAWKKNGEGREVAAREVRKRRRPLVGGGGRDGAQRAEAAEESSEVVVVVVVVVVVEVVVGLE